MSRVMRAFGVPLVATLVACSSSVPRTGVDSTSPLRIVVRSPVTTLDPQLTNDFTTSSLLASVYEPLVRLDDHMRPIPALAASWSTPALDLWRFELHKDARFHDGRPVRAADVCASLLRGLNLPGSFEGTKLALVETVRVIDPETVEIQTRGPAPLLLAGLRDALILPEGTEPKQASSAIGSGPYRIAAWDSHRLELEAVPRAAGSVTPEFSKVVVTWNGDARARTREVLEGQADLAEFPLPDDLELVASSSAARVLSRPSWSLAVLGFRVTPGSGPFSNPKIRKAVAQLVDRHQLVSEAARGHGQPAFHLAPSGAVGFFRDLSADPYDPAAAARTLRAAWPRGATETLVHVDRDRSVARVLQSAFATAGVGLKLVERPFAELDQAMVSLRAPAWLVQLTFTSRDASDLLNDMLHTRSPDRRWGQINASGLSDPELDRLLESAAREMDGRRRLALLEKAGSRALESRALIPLFTADTLYVASRRVRYEGNLSGRLEPHEIGLAPVETGR